LLDRLRFVERARTRPPFPMDLFEALTPPVCPLSNTRFASKLGQRGVTGLSVPAAGNEKPHQ
jgi:hypothetical protein